jgi:subtilisin family serine protease/subtilisin-like proprotein convertase family protein
MKITFAAALIFLFSTLTFSQDYFFYSGSKQKMFLNRNLGYVTVKFKNNTSHAKKDRVYSKISQYSEKRIDFTNKINEFNSTDVLIVQIKQGMPDKLSEIERNLSGDSNIEYVGMCFNYNDKVLHFSTNEIIVKFKNNVSFKEIGNLNKMFKTEISEKADLFNNVYVLKISPGSADNVFETSNKYSLTQFVEFAQPNFIRSGMLLSSGESEFKADTVTTNDTLLPQMWHIKNTGSNIPDGVQGIQGCDMNVEPAWDITTGNPNVLIAILDTGIDTNHTDLRPNLCDRSLWYDAYDNDQKPYDEHYHGTGVSGTSAAVGNNIAGTVGVAFNCKILPVKVFGPAPTVLTTDLILAKGLNWAWMHGAAVMNCSWGGGIPTPLIEHAITNAFNYGRNGKGSVVFGGAGNADTNIVIFPASMPGVIGVGGLSPCNQRKSKFSCDNIGGVQNWGACFGEGMSIVAPTTYIGTTQLGGTWCICGNGTSVSSPLAAGVGALIISKNNDISGDSVKIIIETTAKKVGNYQYNIPKENGMWDYEMGYGRIDAKACLDATPNGSSAGNEQVSPVINIYPPESRPYQVQMQLNAEIYDISGLGTGNNEPRLYYKYLSGNDFQYINGTKIYGNMYNFVFPYVSYTDGFWYYVAAQDNNPVPNFITYPLGGSGVNPPGINPPVKLMYVRNTLKSDTTLASTNVPIHISSSRETSFVSTMNVPLNRTILSAEVMVNIQHTFDADLTFSLISPQGTEIILAGGVGWDGNDFSNTIFDDRAGVSIDSSLAAAPFSGRFKPIERLWLLAGENSYGEWKLKVVDNGAADGGDLLGWNVKFIFANGSDNVIPWGYDLVKNYPNPFNPKTRIIFNVPKSSLVKIVLYDVTGKEVSVILNESRERAFADFVDFTAPAWLASGVYFYSMYADGNYIDSKKMVFIK